MQRVARINSGDDRSVAIRSLIAEPDEWKLGLKMRGPTLSCLSILLLCLGITGSEVQPTCREITGYTVCDKKGTLVDVTQHEFVDMLEIFDLDLLAIRENAFKNLTLTKLDLSMGNKISVASRESFRGLEKLTRLDLDSNPLPLSPNLFAEMTQLRALSLVFNKIDKIPKDTFAGLTSLAWLYLGHNDIESINADSFSGLSSSLMFLWMNDNKISNIESGAFSGMTELSRLHLENNKLTSIQTVLRGLHKLDGLFLADNQLTSIAKTDFKGLFDLRILNLQNNQIASIEPGAFSDLSQLEQLYLKKNKLTQVNIGIFNGLSNLKKLDLSNNLISVVQADSFAGLSALKTLYLANNKLPNVDRKKFGLTALTALYT